MPRWLNSWFSRTPASTTDPSSPPTSPSPPSNAQIYTFENQKYKTGSSNYLSVDGLIYKYAILTKINNKYSPVETDFSYSFQNRENSSVNSRDVQNHRKRHLSSLKNQGSINDRFDFEKENSINSISENKRINGINGIHDETAQTNSVPNHKEDERRIQETQTQGGVSQPTDPTQLKSDIAFLVDTLRSIAEILIWGDQNEPRVFEYFLEQNIFAHFLNVLYLDLEKQYRTEISVQVLQTLNILFENLKLPTSFYFLLSNNHINEIISYNFDFEENEEMLAYYISFLKTLSLKLDCDTVHFYFNEHANKYPLYLVGVGFLGDLLR